MWLFSKKKRQERRITRVSSLISALLELNGNTSIDLEYSHAIVTLRAIKDKETADAITAKESLSIARESAQGAIEIKRNNQVRWLEYQSKVEALLAENPLTSSEAQICKINFEDYQKQATEIFTKLLLKPDNESLTVTVKYCGITTSVIYRIDNFDEKQLLQSEEPTNKAAASPTIETTEPPAVSSISAEPVADDFVEPEEKSAPLQNSNEPLVSDDGQVQIEAVSEQPAAETDPIMERRKAIRAYFDSNPELARLRKAYEPDDTFPGLIAKELVYAKEDEI